MRPVTVVFDLGKVLLDFDYSIAVKRLLQRSTIQPAELLTLLQSPLLLQYEGGEFETAEFFARIKTISGFMGEIEEFCEAFGDIFSPIQPMIDAQAALRRKGIPTYILSNTNEIAIRHVRRSFPFFQNFDGYILSYERQALKPEPPIYQMVEATCGHRGPAIVYIDDRPENVATGLKLGWQGIVHETPDKTLAELGKLGLLP